MQISIPDLALVVLVGPSGAGKSTFARTHFKPTEVLSSDFCRGLVSDGENNQSATNEAFDVFHYITRKRLFVGEGALKRLKLAAAKTIKSGVSILTYQPA
jgi:protein phosphatase